MKNVLIYGDSNIWGENFSGDRIKYHLRWTNRLKKSLKNKYKITSNGVCGRIAGNYRLDKPNKNGQSHFSDLINKKNDFDIIIIALGTNDLQEKYNRNVDNIIQDLNWYKNRLKNKKVIFTLPPKFKTTEESGPDFTENSAKKLDELVQRKEELGETIYIGSLDLSDGIHFSNTGHKIMSEKVKKAMEALDL